MKKLLVLGGTYFQIPVIEYAKSRGHYVITCDYLPNNPGHKLSHEYHNISTTEKEDVLTLAKKLKIDGILAFASDPAAPTAAYVSEKLGLTGNKFETVQLMSEKFLFRDFLLKNSFNVPQFKQYSDLESLFKDIDSFAFPMIIKPNDSSGSKGVSRIDKAEDIPSLFTLAMGYSRCKRIIVEEYIEGPQFHGDAFVNNNQVVFSYLGDHYFNGSLNSSTMYPSKFPAEIIENMEKDLQHFITLVGFKQGGVNVEIRLSNKNKKPYIIEIGPRNGGHFTPNIIQYASGFNFIKASVDSALGLDFQNQKTKKQGYYVNLVLYSKKSGIFQEVEISDTLKPHILESCIYKQKGDEILPGTTSNTSIGTLLLKFDSLDDMHYHVDNSYAYYSVKLSN